MGTAARRAARGPHQRTALRGVTVSALLIASVGSGGLPGEAQDAVALAAGPDGRSMSTAAASCWEIKQITPTATSGVYWLVTPRLQRPDQFYCDMTTDGGGWVLIGRGRENWRGEYEGVGSTSEVRSVVTGSGAFRVKQLHSKTVDGLLNGGRVDALGDGVRLRRATNAAGTTWQEARFKMIRRDRWVWTFRARHPLSSMSFDGVTGGNGSSVDFGADNALKRVNTDLTSAQAWTAGWAFGSSVTGSSDPASYLWSARAGLGYARPFTQVYLRPKLVSSQLTYPQIPDSGAPAQSLTRLAETRAQPTVWGVAGLASNNGQSTEMRTEAQAFAQIGNRVFVGGNFKTVQKNAAGAERVAQSYLAAFDVNTGQLDTGFRPVFDNQIKALAALPNGNLAVGGEFGTVNGVASPGLAVLNPANGGAVPSFKARVENRLTNGQVSIRSLKVHGGRLYLGGAFTHITGGANTGATFLRSGGRIDAGSGLPDPTWNPNFNGTVTEITPSTDGVRVYAVGYFTTSNGRAANRIAALSSAAGATVVPWTPKYSVTPTRPDTFQFTIEEGAQRVWVGGSQHSLFSYNRPSLAFISGGISMPGGDFQTAVVDKELLYAGCHCGDFFFTGPTVYVWPYLADQADKLGFVGAWNADSGAYQPEFDPILKARGGYGAWATFVDSRGVLWIGGSFESSVAVGGRNQWSGGFIRFAPRDSVAPATPANLSVSGAAGTVKLSWSGTLEPGGVYEIYQNDRVVATATATSVSLPAPAARVRYAVRAADGAGNRSATTTVASFQPVAAAQQPARSTAG